MRTTISVAKFVTSAVQYTSASFHEDKQANHQMIDNYITMPIDRLISILAKKILFFYQLLQFMYSDSKL